MPDQDPVFDRRVVEALERTRDLPSVPAVALEVLRVAQNEEAKAEDLAAVVSLDPALAAKVLKVANSALFGRRAEITTLQRACTQLGFTTIKLWALSFTMVDSLDRPEVEGFDFDEYWKRSLVRAVSAKLLAEVVSPRLADEAFIAGVLSRIGQLVLARCLPGEYRAVLAACSDSWPSQDLQRKTLGFSSDELGVALLHSWKLPSIIYKAVRWAPNVSEIDEDLPALTKRLAQILSVAADCEDLAFGSSKSKALTKLHDAAKQYVGLEPEQVEVLLARVDDRTIEIAEILQIKIRSSLDMPEILRSAQLELLRETISLLHHAVVNEERAAQLQFENSLLLLKAQTDPVTGLADRNTFQETLAACAGSETGANQHFRTALLKITIDNFKAISKKHGTQAADRILQSVTKVIREASGKSDLAARFGEGEFAVIMPRTTPEELPNVAENIRSRIQPLVTDTGKIAVTVSIGGAHTEALESGAAPKALIDLAEHHASQAKAHGGNQCRFPTGSVA